MKLYISYYENYIAIVEGIYNKKKEKFNIKNTLILNSEDIDDSKYEDKKYALLREALTLNQYKSKDVVFLLNTRDVIIKYHNAQKVQPKDLDGIMNNEMYEVMSLDYDQYTFSYEVTNENEEETPNTLDMIVAAIANDELEKIMDIFKEFKLNIERIDTMSSAYSRLVNELEYEDIMLLNIGNYGSIVNIYKDDSLFIHDNIPIRVSEGTGSSMGISLALIDEIRGLMNFYSSRNFGKTLDNIVLLGQSNTNIDIIEGFKESFNTKIVSGIENLFDIEKYLQGDIQKDEISKISDILGSMAIVEDNKTYRHMNLLPLSIRNRQNKKEVLKQSALAIPLLVALLASPYVGLSYMEYRALKQTEVVQARLDEILVQFKDIEEIDAKITLAQEEISIYDMLSSKEVSWGPILASIDKSIPYRVDLTNIDVYYDESLVDPSSKEESEDGDFSIENKPTDGTTEENIEQEEETEQEIPIYEQIPNTIELKGISNNSKNVGQFVYSLNKLDYFESVKLINTSEDEEVNGQAFNIIIVLREGVVSGDE